MTKMSLGWLTTCLLLVAGLTSTKGSFFNKKVDDNNCDDSWIQRLGTCYQWNNQALVTWGEARLECQLKGADLLTYNDKWDGAWISDQTAQYTTDNWWIGLYRDMSQITDPKQIPQWVWVNSSVHDTSLLNWDKEPDNWNNQDCISVDEEGKFADDSCNEKYGYICKYSLQPGQMCMNQWMNFSTNCYYFSDGRNESFRLTWNNAVNMCDQLATGKGAQLLSIYGQDEAAFIATQLPLKSWAMVKWWTGMNDIANEGVYIWPDGNLVDTTIISWDSSPTHDARSAQNCAIMSVGGRMNDEKCSAGAHYICQKPKQIYYFDVGCGLNWLRADMSCYMMSSLETHDRATARQLCKSAGGDLLKVTSRDEITWLQTQNIGGGGFWVGLNDIGQENNFKWADGSTPRSDLIHWVHEPNQWMGSEHCGEVLRDGGFNDFNCNKKIGYICEYPQNPGVSCLPGWITRGNSGCYYVSNAANSSYYKTWYEARLSCFNLAQEQSKDRTMKATLLNIVDKNELTWIQQQLANTSKDSTGWWTALSDAAFHGYWIWVDTNIQATNKNVKWAAEPNDFKHSEDCVVMYEGYRLNDMDCTSKQNMICKRSLASGGHSPVYGARVLWVTGVLLIVSNLVR